jgi:hypothetical protein
MRQPTSKVGYGFPQRQIVAAADKQIGQLVYELYGLMKDEITLIEGG